MSGGHHHNCTEGALLIVIGDPWYLAALAIQHGLTVCSADTDFARFSEIRWTNPLADGG